MNLFYHISNISVAIIFAAVTGFTAYEYGPQLWAELDAVFASMLAVAALLGSLVVGFATMESRPI